MFPDAGDAGFIHPLDGFKKLKPYFEEAMRVGFYIKAVPAIFHNEFDNWVIRILGEEMME